MNNNADFTKIAKKARTYEELAELAKESGIELPETEGGILDDNALGSVNGGAPDAYDPQVESVYPECSSYCSWYCQYLCTYNMTAHLNRNQKCQKFS